MIKQVYKINASKSKVWKALVDPKLITKWGGGPAKMQDEVGFNFSLWGGDIWGRNNKVVKEKLLEQDWYGGKWDKPSKVKFELLEKDGVTAVKLTHSNIPENEQSFADGWKDYYMGPLKELVEK